MHIQTALIAIALALASPPASAQAQSKPALPDFTLEELMRIEIEPVFGASKRLQPVTEAPASVTIVTREEIARYGYRSLADVLRGVRGFFVTTDRNYSYLGARGFARPGDYGTRILLLVDGHRMNDNIYDQAAIGHDFGVDAAMFERVEIVRGPSSALYGTSAFFAVVNVIMRKGGDLDGFTASADIGSFGSRSAMLGFGARLPHGMDVAVSASHHRRDGPSRLYFPEFDAPETNGGIAEGLDDEDATQLFGRFNVAGLTLTGAYGRRGKSIPTAAYYSLFNDPRMETVDRRGFVDAEYDRTAGGGRVAVRGYVDRYHYDGTYPYDPSAPADLDYAIGTWAGGEARFTRDVGRKQAITAGTEFRHSFRQAQGYTSGTGDGSFAVDRTANAAAVFVQDEVDLHSAVHLTVGARYDASGEFSRMTPRVSLIVTPSNRQAFKYLYGTAFRAPNAYELDYYSGGVRNETLRPERITSHELVWELYTGSWLRTSASVYRNDVSNLLTLREDPTAAQDLTWMNYDRVLSTGAEVETEWRLKRFEGLASYTRQRTTDRATGARLTNSPSQAAKLRFSTPGPVRGSSLALETQYLSPRLTLRGHRTSSVKVANLTVVQPLGITLDLVGAIRNLFDARYGDPGSEEHRQDVLEQDGRTFSLALRWRFRKP